MKLATKCELPFLCDNVVLSLTPELLHNVYESSLFTSQFRYLHTSSFTQNTFSVPLRMAAEKGHTPTVERLLEGRADINYKNKARKGSLIFLLTYTAVKW